jgi:HSP20 family protein
MLSKLLASICSYSYIYSASEPEFAHPLMKVLEISKFFKEEKMTSLINRGNIFDDFFRDVAPGFYVRPLHGDPLPTPSQIKLDVKETEREYTVHAEVPGVSKDDIHVSLDGNVVTLRAEIKQQDSSNKDQKILRSERYFGEVSRSFQLPVDIEQSEVFAKYDNGVLTLNLPKKRTSGGVQRIKIE